MKRAWQVSNLLCLALGAFVIVQALDYPFFDTTGPGAGFFPFWLGVLMVALSLGLFLQTTLGKSMDTVEGSLLPDRAGGMRVLAVVAGLVVVIVLLVPLGFRITILLFLVYLPVALGIRNWLFTLAFALIGSFGVFHVFYYWLQVPLPLGLFGI